MNAISGIVTSLIDLFERVPHWFTAIIARVGLASAFWLSARTKVLTGEDAGFLELSDTTFFLFEHEYALPIIPHNLAAYMATYAEHLFPILLVIGLATRFSALALLGMTLVIQIFVYPNAWGLHATWAALALYLMSRGPGCISLDYFVKKVSNK